MAILDNTIVTTTAVPITHALQRDGAAAVPWLLAVYALASTVVQPLYGKLADAIGVRSVMLLTLTAFIVGSLLCGLAATMPELIAFRAPQGLGGGGIMSMAMVLIGHLRAEEGGVHTANSSNAIAVAMVGTISARKPDGERTRFEPTGRCPIWSPAPARKGTVTGRIWSQPPCP